MKFFIDSHALECLGELKLLDKSKRHNFMLNLVDPDVNVRVKTLNEITSILRNNILFEAAASQGNNVANDELEVINLDELTRQLIRWFIFRPIIKSEEILDLLILIFSVSLFYPQIDLYNLTIYNFFSEKTFSDTSQSP